MRMFVVSSDVFTRFVYRKENMESYVGLVCGGKTHEELSDFVKEALCVDEMFTNLNRLFLATGHIGHILTASRGLYNLNVENMLILVEDYRLPTLTCYHYKDYIYRHIA